MNNCLLCESKRHYDKGLELKNKLKFISHKQLLDSIHK